MTKYWVRTLLGLGICGLAVVLFDNGLYHVVRTGSCGSDGTYIAIRPCPPGTGGHILSIIGGVFLGLFGVALYATRGSGGRPGGFGASAGGTIGLGAVMWSLLFLTIVLSVCVAAFGPAANDSDGSKTVAIGLAVIFVPMGLAPLPFALMAGRKRGKLVGLAEQGKRCSGVVLHVEDTGMTINDNPHVKITVRAEPPGEPPFTVVKKATVSRVKIPREGDRVVVFYDPANRTGSNGITFDHVPGFTHPGQSAAAARPPSIFTPPTPSPKPDEEDDPLEKISKLGQLRDRGLITAAEFEEQKARLLKEV